MYDTDNAIATEIQGEILFSPTRCNGYETTQWVEDQIDHNCTAGGNHSVGEECSGLPWEQPWTETVGSWVTTCHPWPLYIDAPPSVGGGGGDSSSSSSETTNPDDRNLTIGTSPFKPRNDRECKKIKKVLEDLNPEYMDKVRDLKNKDDLTYETSVALFMDDTVNEYEGVENDSQVNTLPTHPSSDYVSMAHVHNEVDDIKSYSVPSLGDLQWIARRYKDGFLNSSKFVAFLTTADGTYFALTINNTNKLWEFFRYMDAANFSPSITVTERQLASAKLAEVYTPILEKYYYDKEYSLIKENAQGVPNNREQLKYFMQFLNEADAGITVFESNENFNTFTKLGLNGNTVTREPQPCQL